MLPARTKTTLSDKEQLCFKCPLDDCKKSDPQCLLFTKPQKALAETVIKRVKFRPPPQTIVVTKWRKPTPSENSHFVPLQCRKCGAEKMKIHCIIKYAHTVITLRCVECRHKAHLDERKNKA